MSKKIGESTHMYAVLRRRIPFALLFTLLLMLVTTVSAFAGDPTGERLLAESDDPSGVAITFVWIMVASSMVFLMQAGFALLEAGFTRSKNTVNVLTKNFMDFCIGGLAYFFFGYAIMYGASIGGFIGSDGFLLLGDYYDVEHTLAWFFQMVFAATAATIVSGAMAERTRITAYLAYSFLISAIIYPISGHWVWGGGWLSELGFHDFAGSGVVHMIGGFIALTGAYLVGPRLGKYNKDGSANEFKPTNVLYIVLGGFILFFGWFGFNGGSTLSGTDLRMSVIAVNTFLAGCAGATVVMYSRLVSTGKSDGVGAVNGALAGLVGITAGCAVVAPWAAAIIGLLSGFVLMWAEKFVERTLKVDDPVGAIAVHGFCGFFGLIMVGIFADGTYGDISGLIVGNVGQLITQLIGALVLAAWALVMGFAMFAIIKYAIGLRASDEEQVKGLDVTEHGMVAYEPGLAGMPAAGDD
jgi:ammonium transporter, Amt family